MPKIDSKEAKIKNLELQIERLEKMNHVKSTVLSILAHNAIPPLIYMKNITDFSLNNWDKLQAKELKDCAIAMNESSSSLHRLSQSVLEWTRHQGEFKFNAQKKVYLLDVVDEEMIFFKPLFERKNLLIEIQVDPHHAVKGEFAIYRLILQNLISNAIKFSLQGGHILIYSHKVDHGIQLTVKDRGIGIASEQLHKINSRTKLNAKKGTDNELGYGMGLLIIEDFLAQIGGSLGIESKEGQGTEVTLYFPKA